MGSSSELDLVIDLRPDTGMALHRQIYEQIRVAILTGRVRSHQKLPASRQLAISLGVSRTTVTQSYDQLISEGYLQTKPGAGTFVCAQVPDSLLSINPTRNDIARDSASELETAALETAAQPPLADLFSAYGDRLSRLPKRASAFTATQLQARTQSKPVLSFRYWQPDVSLFPIEQWQRCINRYRANSTDWMNYSQDSLGYEPLRNEIASYVAQTRAVHCHPDQILITQGTQQALHLIARVLLDTGDVIALENPGYLSARQIFGSHSATLVPIAVDDEGMQVNEPDGLVGQSARLRIKLAYVTPSHQFPTGVLMSLSRRLALLQWAHQTNALIIEDDYDSEFRYSGRPVPALQGLDTHQRVLYIGTFSKVMFPGLQLGYVVLPPSLVSVFAQAKWMCDRQSCLIHQAALTDFIAKGHLSKHIRRMRTLYAQRREALIVALESASSRSLSQVGEPAGLHIMVNLHTAPKPDHQLVSQAEKQAVKLFSAQPYYLPAPLCPFPHSMNRSVNGEFIFGFGGLNQAEIAIAIARIRPCL
ncbi:MAG: PLP-dependent aminotransferase family protein [Cyanobacteria bacterium P01_D01_bin.1]